MSVKGKVKVDQPGKQRVRICKLKKDGELEEVERREQNPIVFCSKCQAKADDPLAVCNPRALKVVKK